MLPFVRVAYFLHTICGYPHYGAYVRAEAVVEFKHKLGPGVVTHPVGESAFVIDVGLRLFRG